jgi:hypothetical protein
MLTVPIVMAEAVMAPIKYEELNRDVMEARSLGYESSPIMADPAIIQKTMPNPRSIRAMMYIATKDLLELCKDTLDRFTYNVERSTGEVLQRT